NEGIFLLPYPESELVQNPLLKEPPVSYEFTEERITDLF
ncbi:RagB/SusD family nutrient uptake outer membrane protein, partial [termite gut metagenome]